MGTILLVDDDLEIREIAADIFRDEGYDVVAVEHGQQALDILGAGVRPDLILLDLMMPILDGWQFRAAQLQQPALAAIPVVVLTASPNDGAPYGLEVLPKPFRTEELLLIARRYVLGTRYVP